METPVLSRQGIVVLVATALMVVWGLLGALDVRNQSYTGYVTDGDNTITQVTAGSPADVAGLETGDHIRRIDGIAVEDQRVALQRPRPAIGERQTIEVERNGRTVSVDQVSAALPTSLALLRHGVILVGFSFLFSGVWAFLAVPSQRTRLLAVLGFAFSAGFSAGPYFTSPTVRAAAGAVLTLAITAGLAVLTHFLLVFPTPKRMMRRRTTIWALYGPAAVVGLLTVWVAAAQPAATSGVNVFFRTLFGLAVVGYFAASLVALAHSYVKADARSRVCTGLNLLLAGAAVGLGPSLLITLAGLVAPQVVIPGAGFFLLGIGVLPVTFVLAAVRAGRALPTPSVTTMDRGLSPVGPAANATTSRASRRSE